jgi:molecular chaperone GrpE (heat shock protein)
MNRKSKQSNKKPVANEHQGTHLSDVIPQDLAEKLKQLRNEKEEELRKQQEEEMIRKQFEAKQREKNKSFAELLGESKMDWRKFK